MHPHINIIDCIKCAYIYGWIYIYKNIFFFLFSCASLMHRRLLYKFCCQQKNFTLVDGKFLGKIVKIFDIVTTKYSCLSFSLFQLYNSFLNLFASTFNHRFYSSFFPTIISKKSQIKVTFHVTSTLAVDSILGFEKLCLTYELTVPYK